jgi:hypothetical protein
VKRTINRVASVKRINGDRQLSLHEYTWERLVCPCLECVWVVGMGAKTYGLQMMTGTYCRHKGLHCGGMPRGTREKLKEKTLGSGEGRKSLDGYSVGEIIKAGKSSKRSAGSLRSFLLKARGGQQKPSLNTLPARIDLRPSCTRKRPGNGGCIMFPYNLSPSLKKPSDTRGPVTCPSSHFSTN